MFKQVISACCLVVITSLNSDARPYRMQHASECNVTMPCDFSNYAQIPNQRREVRYLLQIHRTKQLSVVANTNIAASDSPVSTRIVGGRPAGCPSSFCGCAAALRLFGRIVPELNCGKLAEISAYVASTRNGRGKTRARFRPRAAHRGRRLDGVRRQLRWTRNENTCAFFEGVHGCESARDADLNLALYRIGNTVAKHRHLSLGQRQSLVAEAPLFSPVETRPGGSTRSYWFARELEANVLAAPIGGRQPDTVRRRQISRSPALASLPR